MAIKIKTCYLKERLKNMDMIVLGSVIILVSIGILMIYSITGTLMYNNRMGDSLWYVMRTINSTIIGIVGMVLLLFMPYKVLKNIISPLATIGTLGLLVLTLLMGTGTTASSVSRWISIGPISFQPTEFARIGVVLATAWIIHFLVRHKLYYTKRMFGEYLFALLYIVICGGLIMIQPDLGSGLVILGTGMVMFFSSGIHKKQIGMIVLLGMIGIIILIVLGTGLQGYQALRIEVWQDPFSHPRGDQSVMGFISIALGGLRGVGLGQGTQKYGFAIESHTDLIITIVAEELGTITVLLIMFLYFLIAIRCFITAFRGINIYSSLICIGIGAFFLIQPLINLGGVIGLIPLSGVTLPFLSYGGTSLMATFFMIGIYFNARNEIIIRNKKQKLTKKPNSKKVIPFKHEPMN